jgi:hypothetical protein
VSQTNGIWKNMEENEKKVSNVGGPTLHMAQESTPSIFEYVPSIYYYNLLGNYF